MDVVQPCYSHTLTITQGDSLCANPLAQSPGQVKFLKEFV